MGRFASMMLLIPAIAACNGVAPPAGVADASVDVGKTVDGAVTAIDKGGIDLSVVPNYSCNLIDHDHMAAKGTCLQAAQADSIEDHCAGFSVAVKQGNCPTVNAGGKCTYDAGQPAETHIYFYTNYMMPAGQMKVACENDGGVWTAM
jgi:hypothetical protein